MVISYFSALTSTGLSFQILPLYPQPNLRVRTPRSRPSGARFPPHSGASIGKNTIVSSYINQNPPRSLFPGGYTRPEIRVPNLILQLSASDVFRDDKTVLDVIDNSVSDGAGIVVLTGGEGSSKKFYEAACLLKSVIRDRAYLLIDERVDIAAAINASGVVLSDQGLPTIVARNAMMDARTDSVILPLVARNVKTQEAALEASNVEGADFLIYTTKGDVRPEDMVRSVSELVKIPIFIMVDSLMDVTSMNSDWLKSGVSGLAFSVNELNLLGEDAFSKLFQSGLPLLRKIEGGTGSPGLDNLNMGNGLPGKKVVASFSLLKEREQQLIEKERLILLEAINVIQRDIPLMRDISLLKDAVSQLDESFSVVIVGEFNSGKSSFINAFLGEKYLMDGVVPTTNQITFLRYSESEISDQRCERHPDGQYICYIPAPILKEMMIVDTPGTNVILQRQQRLTEEFVPRADLLLFVMSADRPLTESEVTFLRYSQQWKKKIIFVLNKSDLYRNEDELDQAVSFIKENIRKILNTEHVTLFPVSARRALEAKLSGDNGPGKQERLLNTPYPGANCFAGLEKYLHSFLDPSTSNGIERITLKLETPVKIAEQFLSGCQKLAKEEFQQAEQDLVVVNDLLVSVEEYSLKMESESITWKRQILSLVDRALGQAVKLAESALQLSNIDLVTSYVFGRDKSAQMPVTSSLRIEIIDPAVSEALKLLGDYSVWLQSNSARKGNIYREYFEKRWPSVALSIPSQLEASELLKTPHEVGVRVLGNFSAAAASKLFDQEIREVFLGAYGGVGAAGLSASLLTSVLPTTLEDLFALGVCSAGGFLAISSFPTRRRRAIEKLKRAADALARELEEAMEQDLLETNSSLNKMVMLIGKPYQEMAQDRVRQQLHTLTELATVEKKLRTLQTEIQNLHVSR